MITFDQSKEKDITNEGEAVRLYNEIKGYPERTYYNEMFEKTVTVPEQKGIDLVTSTFQEIIDYLNDNTIKKSEVVRTFCRRFMAQQFPLEFDTEKTKVSDGLKTEYNLIQKDKKEDIEWLGEIGFRDTRLDGVKY